MSEIVFLTDPEALPEGGGVFRAGGTDLQERLRTSNDSPRILDLMGIEGFAGISFGAGLGLEHDASDEAVGGDEAVGDTDAARGNELVGGTEANRGEEAGGDTEATGGNELGGGTEATGSKVAVEGAEAAGVDALVGGAEVTGDDVVFEVAEADGGQDADGGDEAVRGDGADEGARRADGGPAPEGEAAGGKHVSGGTRIGAGTRMSVVAEALADSYPALAQTTAGLATPQVRAVGTIGGNLLQHTRCWYARHPDLSCLKTGGTSCPARDGRHLYGVVFDTSACVHPHPSSIAMALLLHDAQVAIAGKGRRTVTELLGDGSDPTRDSLLGEGEVVTAIHLPPPWEEERAAYFRAISRFDAEWPLVEAVGRVRVDQDGRVEDCGIAVGGVAPVPLRMRHAEDLLRGAVLDDAAIAAASAACAQGATPLPETGYKVDLLVATVREVLERVAAD